MGTTTYGYVRVSTREQNTDRQVDALKAFPVDEHNIYVDKQSGKDFCRPEWIRMVKKAKAGDVIVVHSLDRLGRNYNEIIEQWRMLTRGKNVDIVILDMPLLDTRKGNDDLTGLFISDLVLQILSYVAENERNNIRKRQAEGIEAAQKRGVRFGRTQKEKPDNFTAVKEDWTNGLISLRKAALELGVSRETFKKWVFE